MYTHPSQSKRERPQQLRDFSSLLSAMSGHDMAHDWPTWRKMLDYNVGDRLGW
jgi:hypothetical protein